MAAVVRLERERFWPGAGRQALDAWELFLRDPDRFDPDYGCGRLECCREPDPDEAKAIIYAVVHALPPRDARRLRTRLAALDSP